MTACLQAPLSAQFDALPAQWRALITPFTASPAYPALCAAVDARVHADATVLPAMPFAALHATLPEQIRVVILGQDPYHGIEHGIAQAHGLAFSVPDGVKPPPSLRNIYKELAREFGGAPHATGNLMHWAQQGVLLLNAVLTVEQDQPASHAKLGWEALTDHIIAALGSSEHPTVFMLWGGYAQKKAPLIGPMHLVLMANHPSPLAALRPPQPFIGCEHFTQASNWLTAQGGEHIDWLHDTQK
jgi:uracil-DNA glycosylase